MRVIASLVLLVLVAAPVFAGPFVGVQSDTRGDAALGLGWHFGRAGVAAAMYSNNRFGGSVYAFPLATPDSAGVVAPYIRGEFDQDFGPAMYGGTYLLKLAGASVATEGGLAEGGQTAARVWFVYRIW